MALSDAALNLMANAFRAAATHAQLHTGDPGTAGTSNVSSAARQAISWNAASGSGDIDLASAVDFTGGAASGPCTWVSLWSASSSGTFYGRYALTGDQTFNADGEYTLTEITLDGSST